MNLPHEAAGSNIFATEPVSSDNDGNLYICCGLFLMLDALGIVQSFEPWIGEAEPDSYRDWLGVRTRMYYWPPGYMALAGTVQGMPDASRAGLHDVAEWAGVLLAVKEAKNSFVCVELGAGYGPFVVGSASVARKLGLRAIKLIAVEGDAQHVAWMRQHFNDNGFDPSEHRLISGVIGRYDGTARFPKLTNPALEWGAEAMFDDVSGQSGRTPQRTLNSFIEVPCVTIETLVKDLSRVDVMHLDIQGSEVNVIQSAIKTLNAKVRRVVIGTHGRDIEWQLMTLLDKEGWKLEIDKACSFQQQPPHGITLLQDGVQVWCNPKLQ